MPLEESHPIMSTPRNNISLWRYVDIPSFLSILVDESLTFVRADLFEDKYEGKLPIKTANLIDATTIHQVVYGDSTNTRKSFSEILNSQTNSVYLNCWCNENHEMVHMWKIYSKEYGIAIETDYENLKKSIQTNETIYPTEIRYIDFNNEAVDWRSNALTVYTLKRKEYKSENEFRLILSFPKVIEEEIRKNTTTANAAQIRNDIYSKFPVIKCKVDPKMLIKKIHISPYAPNWYLDLIIDLAKKYDLTPESISQSDL